MGALLGVWHYSATAHLNAPSELFPSVPHQRIKWISRYLLSPKALGEAQGKDQSDPVSALGVGGGRLNMEPEKDAEVLARERRGFAVGVWGMAAGGGWREFCFSGKVQNHSFLPLRLWGKSLHPPLHLLAFLIGDYICPQRQVEKVGDYARKEGAHLRGLDFCLSVYCVALGEWTMLSVLLHLGVGNCLSSEQLTWTRSSWRTA